MDNKNYSNIVGIVASAVLPNVGGWISSIYCRDSITTWYQTLKKPSFTPPDWVFGPVWTGIYTGAGYASYLVYQNGGGFNGPARLPLMAYGANLALNWAWSPIFFYMKKLDLAFYEILLLDVSTIATGYLFFIVNKTAGYLFIPYCAWLSLASLLSYRVWKDNKKSIKDQ